MTSVTNVFRVGELVWYRHTAWRLGVILSITPRPGDPASHAAPDSHYDFTLAPLGHALLAQSSLIKDCLSMRPFLTFSVPNAGIDELKDKTFDMVDWQGLTARYSQDPDPAKKSMNQQVIGLEASKLGARAINDAFSTFNLIAQGTTPDGALYIQHYAGVYLGAELVHVGDPVRVTNTGTNIPSTGPSAVPPDATLIMLVDEIQVLTPLNPQGSAGAGSTGRATLQFRGHLYHTVRAPAGGAPPAGAVAAETLGGVFVEELNTRNAIEKDRAMRWSWVRVTAAAAVRGEHDVQGRFYVTERLMRIIDPARLQGWVERGLLEEAPAYLNNRGHSGAGQFLGRRRGRAATLGQAVSVAFQPPTGMVEN